MPPLSYAEVVSAGQADERTLVEVEHLGDRAVLRLADPDKLNVLSAPMMVQLLAAVEGLARDQQLRSIVLTGRGSAFSSGVNGHTVAVSSAYAPHSAAGTCSHARTGDRHASTPPRTTNTTNSR